MANEEANLERLYRILGCIRSPEKWEYFSLEIDHPESGTTRIFAEFYTGKLINKDTGEVTHIVIKIVPVFSIIGSHEQVYANEICFYSRIFPALNQFQKSKRVKNLFNCVPNFLGGHSEDNREFIVMEDVTAAGYESLRNVRYIDGEYIKAVFQTYARFHALSFAYKHEHPEEFRRLTAGLVDLMGYLHSQGLGGGTENCYQAAIDTFNEELESDIVRKLKSVKNVRELFPKARKYDGIYTCVTHGNNLNLFYKYKRNEPEELKVKLIDFQLAYVTTPIHDLAHFFYSGASKHDMDRLDHYLDIYYDSFSEFVKELRADPTELYPYQVFKDEWKRYSVSAVILGMNTWVIKLMDQNEVKEVMTNSTLSKEMKHQYWQDATSRILQQDTFRQRAREVCLHAVEYGVI